MKLSEIISLWRGRMDDLAKPYLWSDSDAVVFANAAENEACERARLLQEDSTDSPLCNIDGTATDATYDLDPRIIEVRSCTWGGHFLKPIDRDTLNQPHLTSNATVYGAYFQYPAWMGTQDWSTLTGTPRFYLVEQQRKLTLVRKPTVAAPIHLSIYRYPLEALSLDNLDAEPEIPARYHLDLIDWMEFLAYDNVDADKGNPERAKAKADRFSSRFGIRPDANVQRKQLEKRSHRVRMNPDW